MRKFYLFLFVLSLLASCSGEKHQEKLPVNQVEAVDPIEDPQSNSDSVESKASEDEFPNDNSAETKAAQKQACAELKSWGAKDAYVDENGYLVYVVNKNDISASGNEVAKSMYELVGEVPGVKGVRVVDNKTKTELGRY